MQNFSSDPRTVMTLDAGGTNFVFSAIRANRPVIESFALPSSADHLKRSLETLLDGFRSVRDRLPAPPVAISFAFSGAFRRGGHAGRATSQAVVGKYVR